MIDSFSIKEMDCDLTIISQDNINNHVEAIFDPMKISESGYRK